MFKAVIFDMDGTLIDTEKYYRECWPKALEKCGYPASDEVALDVRSLGRPFAPLYFKEKFGGDFDYWAVRAERQKLVEACVRERGVQIKPGAVELLNTLREKGILAAIATASPMERTERYLKLAGLDKSYFDRIISATQVAEGKPSPDVYEFACRELCLRPEECLAVEDAPNGVRAAFRAHVPVIMVPDATQPDTELNGMIYACCKTLDQVADILANKCDFDIMNTVSECTERRDS